MATSKKVFGLTFFNAVSTSRKPLVNGRLLLRFHEAVAVVRVQHALQPLALVVASLHVFCAADHLQMFTANSFCLVFSKKFNIISALPIHQPLTLSQKIDSRGGLFWCKKRLVVHAVKVNIYLKTSPLTPVFGHFAAECSAFWC